MKEFINHIIPNLKNTSEKLNASAILKNQQWILVNEDGITNNTYIFRDNKELLIVVDGNVTVGGWEFITKDKLLIKVDNEMLLYRNQLIDNKLLALKKDGSSAFSVFLNEKVADEFLNNVLKIESHLNSFYNLNSIKDKQIVYKNIEDKTSVQEKVDSPEVKFNDIIPLLFFVILFGVIALLILFSKE